MSLSTIFKVRLFKKNFKKEKKQKNQEANQKEQKQNNKAIQDFKPK